MSSSDAPAGIGAWSPPVLRGLLVAELRKMLSTSVWWALLIPPAVISALAGWLAPAASGLGLSPSLSEASTLSSFGAIFVTLLGVVCATSEFRHRTATTSYLTSAGRLQLLAAKVVVCAAFAVGYAVVCAVLDLSCVAIAGGDFTGGELVSSVEVALVAVLVYVLWATLGVGVGMLFGNQLAAVLVVLLYILLGERIIGYLASTSGIGRIDEYLPAGAATAAVTDVASSGGLGLLLQNTLPWGLALFIFLGYSLVLLLAGAAVAQSRDIT
jgi:ABC-type transport system involved in multi-copper enzyme maturation permease subunit